MFAIADIRAVAQREILPACVADYPLGNVDYSNWNVQMVAEPDSTRVAVRVMAYRKCDGYIMYQQQLFDPTFTSSPELMLNQLDYEIQFMVEQIVSTPLPHLNGVDCASIECADCYS